MGARRQAASEQKEGHAARSRCVESGAENRPAAGRSCAALACAATLAGEAPQQGKKQKKVC